MRRAKLTICAMVTAGVAIASTTMTAKADEHKSDPAQVGRGAKAWAENCARCHNLRDPKELEDYEWDVTVSHMRVRANLPGDVARDIAAFLKASN